MSKDPLEMVKEMVEQVGKPKAERLLILNEISPSMAYKLVREQYKSPIRSLYAGLIEKAFKAAQDENKSA